jgi:hypothetical protein
MPCRTPTPRPADRLGRFVGQNERFYSEVAPAVWPECRSGVGNGSCAELQRHPEEAPKLLVATVTIKRRRVCQPNRKNSTGL